MLHAFCFAIACAWDIGRLTCSLILCVFSKENLSPSARPTGWVSAKDGPQLFGPWMSFQTRMDR
jgi:hypothetical protein